MPGRKSLLVPVCSIACIMFFEDNNYLLSYPLFILFAEYLKYSRFELCKVVSRCFLYAVEWYWLCLDKERVVLGIMPMKNLKWCPWKEWELYQVMFHCIGSLHLSLQIKLRVKVAWFHSSHKLLMLLGQMSAGSPQLPTMASPMGVTSSRQSHKQALMGARTPSPRTWGQHATNCTSQRIGSYTVRKNLVFLNGASGLETKQNAPASYAIHRESSFSSFLGIW